MKQFIFNILLACILTQVYGQTSSQHDIKATLEAQIPILLKEHKTPGIAIAILKNGKVYYKKGFGYGNTQKQEVISTHTGFNIGSISKTFTAWGVMKLVEQGKLNLDTPVTTYLTRWQFPASKYDTDKVTTRAILNHTAGLSVHGYPGFSSAKNLPTLEASLNGENGPANENEKVDIILEPQTKFKYSGGGYTILQLVIEEVTGMSFSAYMDKAIFKPLKMKHTSFNLSSHILQDSATPYDEEGNEMYLVRFTAQAAAGLHTTLDDLILFSKASFSKNPILSSESFTTLITPTEVANNDYGLGYMVMDRFGFRIIGHAGSNDGWQSGMMFNFETNSGIIMLTNGSNGKNVLFPCLQKWAQWHKKNME
ncbi:serine hydrolase domain-containing protein [uncultured Dokdonia sp.]|uniref:serine hydrolase domain-containing protein n=1 Tax=uncultured Dokdonia sp. TaxID=575653 RepID=UPI0026365347|nr:serine hydrolase domain-containing protein [uncultured Dokdonia sp.]